MQEKTEKILQGKFSVRQTITSIEKVTHPRGNETKQHTLSTLKRPAAKVSSRRSSIQLEQFFMIC